MESGYSNMHIKMETNDLHQELDYGEHNIMPNFDNGDDFSGIMPNNEIFSQDALLDGDDAISKCDEDDIIYVYMDIRNPIKTLKTLLEEKVNMNLLKYDVYLQNVQLLEPHKNLVDQCVKGEGLVQINAQVRPNSRRINIVDVVKPTEEVLAEMSAFDANNQDSIDGGDEGSSSAATAMDEDTHDGDATTVSDSDAATQDDENPELVNWIVDPKFKREQKALKIPEDPSLWSREHVRHWLEWAIRQFNLNQIKMSEWNLTGRELVDMSLEEFQVKVPNDPCNRFWTHLELLRKCNFIAVNHTGDPNDLLEEDDEELERREKQAIFKKQQRVLGSSKPTAVRRDLKPFPNIANIGIETTPQGNRSGNNGQIQLWQFLLDILTDKEHRNIIQWIDGYEGEFKLNEPEKVASLWGERKNKPNMNYEKLSRALRYYYDGDMISKVQGKRFVYKFVCDLQHLIGYSGQQLMQLVNENEPTPTTPFSSY